MNCLVCSQPIEEGRRRGGASKRSKILREMPTRSSAKRQAEVHLAPRIRRFSRNAILRRPQPSLSSAQPNDSYDRPATLVHQAPSRAIGFNDEG